MGLSRKRINGQLTDAEREQRRAAARKPKRMTKAELRQRRTNAPIAAAVRFNVRTGDELEARTYSNTRTGRKLARRAILEARRIYRMAQVEAAETLVKGMRGILPGSSAGSMIEASKTIASKGGNSDTAILKLAGKTGAAPIRIAVGMDEIEAAEAAARAEANEPEA